MSEKVTPQKKKETKQKKTEESSFEKNIRDFAEEMEHLGKKTGKHIEQGMRQFSEEVSDLGKHAEKTGKHVETWYDRTFGVFGPLLASFIGFIILLLIIKAMELLGEDVLTFHDISIFLFSNLALFFALILFFSYASYYSRRYHSHVRWISPILSAVGFVLVLWIVIEIFKILNFLDISFLETLGLSIERHLIALFILILAIGYLIFFLAMLMKHTMVPGETARPHPEDTKQQSISVSHPVNAHDYKPLYRSGKHRILGGVCGGIADYFHIDPLLVRLLWIIGTVISVGFLILMYFLFWIMIPRNPNHEWQ